MQSMAYALPIRPGQFEALAQLTVEVASNRADDEHQLKIQEGLSRLKVFRQHFPQEMMVVYFEADDIEEALSSHLQADHDHYDWLLSKLQEITDFVPPYDQSTGRLSAELVMDWHEEHGPSVSHLG